MSQYSLLQAIIIYRQDNKMISNAQLVSNYQRHTNKS